MIFAVSHQSAASAVAETSASKSARTRERILTAAAHVLSRKGYAGTRLADVADEARVQAPAIYYYFPSREALVEEVMRTGITLMREHVGQVLAVLPAGTGPMERIDAAVAAHLRYSLGISDYTTAAIRNAGQVPDDIRIRYSAEAAKYGEVCAGCCRTRRTLGCCTPAWNRWRPGCSSSARSTGRPNGGTRTVARWTRSSGPPSRWSAAACLRAPRLRPLPGRPLRWVPPSAPSPAAYP